MTLREYVTAVLRHWVVVAVCAVLGALAGFGYARSEPKVYQSSASVMVVPEQGENAAELVQGSNYVQNLVASYAVLAQSPYVLEPVIEDLGLDTTPARLARSVSVNTPLNTVVIEIAVSDTSPDRAREIADGISDQLALAVPELSPQLADRSSAVRITTIAPARQPVNPIAPNTRMLMMVGLAAGLAVGVTYAVLRELLARRVVSSSSIQSMLGVPFLGEVVKVPSRTSLPAVVAAGPGSRPSESVRTLVANVRFADVDHGRRVLMVSSGDAGEGKSSIAISLALSLAEDGSSVLLVDADLRRPSIARVTGLEGSVGLTNLLVGDVAQEDIVLPWTRPNLFVLPSGVLPANPGVLLSSERLVAVIGDLRKHYDYVVIDTAPILPLSDPLWLSRAVDGVLVVARARKTRISRLRQTVDKFERGEADVIGIVLNDVKPRGRSAYYVNDSRVGVPGAFSREPGSPDVRPAATADDAAAPRAVEDADRRTTP